MLSELHVGLDQDLDHLIDHNKDEPEEQEPIAFGELH
jgi:hypothetical protein